MKKINIEKIENPTGTQADLAAAGIKINELIDERNRMAEEAHAMVEKIASLEGENDKLKKDIDQLQKVVYLLTQQFPQHHHLPNGQVGIALASKP